MNTNVNILSKKLENKSIIDSILESRGIVKEDFIYPEKRELMSSYIFSDMEKAVEIIKNAIENKEGILVWGDFDADGVTSTAILCKTLKALGANFTYFLPDRATMGHGLNTKELLKIKAKNNIKVLITVDCGISNLKEIKLIRSMGVKTIITDHHEPQDELPESECILNPIAKNSLKNTLTVSEIESASYLAGAGVSFKLACALLGDNHNELKKEILVLSSIGTVSDVVPLIGENRTIVAKGLIELNNGAHKGVSRLFEKQNLKREVKSEDVAFILAPRINAAGRLDSPFESIKLLIEENPLVIDMTIEKLDSLNKIRQNLCENVLAEALSMIKKPADCIVLYKEDWHLGIIGIVAAKLVEKYNKPAFLITKDENGIFRCSIRSMECYDIAKILKSMEDLFLGYGGHSGAGGFSADSNTVTIEELTKRIDEAVSDFKDESKIINAINVDIELNGYDITPELVKEIDILEPFGAGNRRPTFLIRNAKLIQKRLIGKDLNHIAYNVIKDGIEFNCLFWKRKVLGLNEGDMVDFIFKPELNSFNDDIKLQLITECILNDKLEDNFAKQAKFFDHRQKTGIYEAINKYIESKKGEVKAYITSIATKKAVEKYHSITNFAIKDGSQKEKTIMLFDYPPSIEELKELIKSIEPDNIHLMKNDFSKNPDEYVSLVCGMLKFASRNKNGEIDIKTLADNAGLDEICIQTLLELLEKIDSIRILDIDKIEFLKAPRLETIHNDSVFELFKDEFQRICAFKTYLQTENADKIKEICLN